MLELTIGDDFATTIESDRQRDADAADAPITILVDTPCVQKLKPDNVKLPDPVDSRCCDKIEEIMKGFDLSSMTGTDEFRPPTVMIKFVVEPPRVYRHATDVSDSQLDR